MIPRELADRIRYRAAKLSGVDAGSILISATRTHSALPAMGCLGTDDNPEYGRLFEDGMVQAIAGAVGKLQPARIGWTSVDDRLGLLWRILTTHLGCARQEELCFDSPCLWSGFQRSSSAPRNLPQNRSSPAPSSAM